MIQKIKSLLAQEKQRLRDPSYQGGGWDVPYGPCLLDLPQEQLIYLKREAYSDILDGYLMLHDNNYINNKVVQQL